MCGITGFYSNSKMEFQKIISKMNEAIAYRGPDASGIWYDKDIGIILGHQRLSILELSSAGSQPMRSKSSRYIITYNGEIYNHFEIREELKRNKMSILWQGNSDTETLLEAIDFWGIEKTLQKIDGMYAFGLYDRKKNNLILARDRMGEKPLYYGYQGNGENTVFLFGSELKSLKEHPLFSPEINRNSVALQLRYNYIPAPYSIYKNIFKLKPGQYLVLSELDLKKNTLANPKNYWSLKDQIIIGKESQINMEEKYQIKSLEDHLKKSVQKQMISDVPIGAFLSGGIDSSTIVSMMQSLSTRPIKTFTVGFDDKEYNEADFAKKIANHLGTDHHELFISSEKIINTIPSIPSIYDEPFSDSSQIPTFLIAKLAKDSVKVALSGDGGDELFCGYNRHIFSKKLSLIFNTTPLMIRKILAEFILCLPINYWNYLGKAFPLFGNHKNLGDKLNRISSSLKLDKLDDLHLNLISQCKNPNDLVINGQESHTLFDNIDQEIRNLELQEQMMVLDQLTYLPDDILVKVDRAAMSSSLETRMPFLDHNLVEFAWRIPHRLKFRNGKGKWIIRKILNNYIPKDLIERPKMGFGVPLDSWLRGSLKDWAEDLIDEKKLKNEGFLNSKIVKNIWNEHLSRKRNCQNELWAILMFQSWLGENNQ